jgi:hypothetical protein
MKKDFSRAVFKHILAWLENNNKPTSKIALQKMLFFLQEKGVPLGYDFEPHTYGPFSRQVMQTATELTSNNEIVTQRTAYATAPEFADPLPDEDKAHIDDLLAGFSNMLEGKFTFDNLELYGTALYCLRALQENKMSWDREALVQEFRAWKGSKYPEDQISAAYNVLVEEFSCNQAEAVQ